MDNRGWNMDETGLDTMQDFQDIYTYVLCIVTHKPRWDRKQMGEKTIIIMFQSLQQAANSMST